MGGDYIAAGKEELNRLSELLEEGIHEYFCSDKYKKYLKTLKTFPSYSFSNIMLIQKQMPEASLVAGYRTWEKKFKRTVKKGEKGIMIYCPVFYNSKKEITVADRDGNLKTEMKNIRVPSFRASYVFDISQTEGEPLPLIEPKEIERNVDNFVHLRNSIIGIADVPVRYGDDAELGGTEKGHYDSNRKEIVLRRGLPEGQEIKTIVHELAHSRLHDSGYLRENGIRIDQKSKEIEAESIAYIVCSHFGLDTSDYSFSYIAAWSNENDISTLRHSMEKIKNESMNIIKDVEGLYLGRNRESNIREVEIDGCEMEL